MAGGLGEPSQAANDFTMIFHDITAEWCLGYGSVHPGLARKTEHQKLERLPRDSFAAIAAPS